MKLSTVIVVTGIALNLAGAALMSSGLFGVEIALGADMDALTAGASMAIAGLFIIVAGVALARREAHNTAAAAAAAAAATADKS